MAEQSLITQWLERIEAKLDRYVERALTRDEFERYKISAQREHDEMKLQIEKLRERAQNREDEANSKAREDSTKWRLFTAGLILTPIVSFFIMRLTQGLGS